MNEVAAEAQEPTALVEHRGSVFRVPGLIIALAVCASLAFLLLTPDGCLMKANMVAYAVCHQIASHSFSLGGQQLPLCARCTGTFVGALVGFFGQAVVLRRSRASHFPSVPILVVLVVFIAVMGADGLNSYLTFFPSAPHVYEPRNWLRLVTGALNGLAMSGLIYPAFNSALWLAPQDSRAIRGFRDLAALLLLEGALVGSVLSGWSLLFWPLALLSALGVLSLLVCVNTIIFVMVVGRENVVSSCRQAIIPLLAGLTLSLLEIGAIDWLRYLLTGTLGPVPVLP